MKDFISNISITDSVSLITIDNLPASVHFMAKVLTAISEKNINVDMINQASVEKRNTGTLSFTITDKDVPQALQVIAKFKQEERSILVEVNSNNTKICVYSELMPNTPGVAAAVFSTLADSQIETKLVTTSEVDISLLISEDDTDKTINALKANCMA